MPHGAFHLWRALSIPFLLMCVCGARPAAAARGPWTEIRGVWSASPDDGLPGDTWGQACAWMDSTGLNAVFPCMIYGPLSWADAAGLVRAGGSGDPLEECIAEAHSRGIQVHVEIVMWKLGRLTAAQADSVSALMQTQVSYSGEVSGWLCPTDPANRAMEIEAIASVAAAYDIDGIQLDYVRFPDGDHCFCNGCRERFQSARHIRRLDWPVDCYWGGRYSEEFREWRRDQITSLVREIGDAVERARPGTAVSAAVVPDLEEARESCGQDWARWASDGLVDFLAPMDYVSDDDSFASLLARQVAVSDVPVVVGIGVFDTGADLTEDQLLHRIEIAREERAGGFAIFHLEPGLVGMLRGVRLGARTQSEP